MSSPVRYVVRRQEYTPPTAAGVRRVLPEKWTAVATFAKPADAHAEYAKLLADARRTLNPFQLGGPNLFYQTSLPAYALHDYLLDHDIAPPPTATSSNPNYVFWWVKNNRTFTDDQRAVVWTACDKLKLFEVVEEDDRAAVWLVVEVPWENDDGYLTTSHEGGKLHSAWPRRRDAKRTMNVIEEARRREWDAWYEREIREEFENSNTAQPEPPDASVRRDNVPFAHLVYLPDTGDPTATPRFVVARQSYGGDTGWYQHAPWYGPNWGMRVPLMSHTDRSTAVKVLQELTRRVKRAVNPFALVWPGSIAPKSLLLAEEIDDRLLPNDIAVDEAFEIVRRLDTTPPPPESNELLADWYDQVVQWSPEFIDVIWGTFADFRLFEVIEVPFG